MRFRSLLAIAGGLLSVARGVNALVDEPIVYRLCRGDVQSVELQRAEGDYRTTVQLSSHASKAFATFTEMNIGKYVIVVAGESILSNAIIRERIDSGRLVSASAREEEAIQLRGAILERLPGSPCGYAQQRSKPDTGKHRGATRDVQ